jgi:hypothetical protein
MHVSADNRRERAKQFYLDGMSPADIAMRTGTKHLTVKRWITRHGWTAEREKLRQSLVKPEVTAAITKELETAYKLYTAAVDERAALVDRWIKRRTSSLNPDNVIAYTGRYSIASHYERVAFCEDIAHLTDIIKLAKREMEKGQSKQSSKPSNKPNPVAPLMVVEGLKDISTSASSCEA